MIVKRHTQLSLENDAIIVNEIDSTKKLNITFQRTIRVPDNDKKSQLPPSLGKFPLFKVKDYAKNLPSHMTRKGGAFFPIHTREAMWINFEANAPFLIKIYAGGINVVSGEPYDETLATQLRRSTLSEEGKDMQDYVVVPDQPWLDGVATAPGVVKQFVAMQAGTGYSLEAQVTGTDQVAGLAFEITPYERPTSGPCPAGSFPIYIMTLTGKKINITVENRFTMMKLKTLVQDAEGIPPDQQRLIYSGMQLDDDGTVWYYGIKAHATLHLVLRLRGGGNPPPESEMSIALGGSIKQMIKPDNYASKKWSSDRTMRFNVQLLNSDVFFRVTGKQPPPTPVNAKAYAAMGLPFYELQEESSDVHGNFKGVKSVGRIDNMQDEMVQPTIVQLSSKPLATPAYEEMKKHVHDADGLLDPDGPLQDFRTTSDMRENLQKSSFTPF